MDCESKVLNSVFVVDELAQPGTSGWVGFVRAEVFHQFDTRQRGRWVTGVSKRSCGYLRSAG